MPSGAVSDASLQVFLGKFSFDKLWPNNPETPNPPVFKMEKLNVDAVVSVTTNFFFTKH